MSWPKLPLDQLGYVSRGRSRHRPRNDPTLYGGPYPFIQTGDVKHANFRITEHTATYSEAGLAQSRLWPKDTLCITIAANIADTALLGYEACFPDSVIGFVADKEKADPRFVKYYFDIIQRELQMVSQGATQDNLSQEKLLSFGIACPPIDVQRQVAEVLSAYDDLIATNQRRIALLEDAARRLYREWFVHLRFPGHESVPVKDGVPEGWLQGSAHDFISILSGGTPKTGVEHYWGGDIPFFTPKDSPDAFYVLGTEKTLTESGLASCNSRLFAKNTTFITARGTVGKVALAQKPMAMNQSCYALAPKQDYDNLFLFAAIKDAVEHFKQVAVGGVFDAIVVDTFKVIPFVLPDAVVTRAFGNAVRPLFQQVETLLLQNSQLAQARDLLLPKLMSGQLDVSGIALPDEVAA